MKQNSNQSNHINETESFDGTKIMNAILIILFISLLLFGNKDISGLTNAP
ncbi:hypothetical protein CQU01_04390 [Cerasibacillus quisquiliarum]|uniref:Uncharacterized protein n=1 Tax=Cerasibacillus quisquiliarum TaxID=227865 RepID=A0A511UWD5_9BACI|nr:hypothetical protein CQU01_04390 [Cerasibacillus quisquiliarum]